ncbi:unnamed protein product [Anisakis simplex]|uniref:Uncharacterized protein n=1 Tax=Anisakis simplex TaxID=6269 RepID=A0A0M3J6Q0_ANISI|nr:unnamed protein product [Anisakis simplex]
MIHLPPPPQQQQQLQAQTSSMKESGGNRKLGVHRLKRERSSADRVVATVIATGSTMNSSAVTGSLQQPAGTVSGVVVSCRVNELVW